MRKIILFLAIIVAFIACEGPMGPQGPAGEKTNWKILTYKVDRDHWVLDGEPNVLGSFYFYEFTENELTNEIYQYGIVHAQLVLNKDRPNERLIPLNRSLPNFETFEDGYELFTEHYEFEYGPRVLAFYFYDSEYFTAAPPETTYFRVVMNW